MRDINIFKVSIAKLEEDIHALEMLITRTRDEKERVSLQVDRAELLDKLDYWYQDMIELGGDMNEAPTK